MRRFWRWAAVAMGAVAALAVGAGTYVYIASEQIIGRHYPLQPSPIQASTDAKVIALGQHLVRPYGCTDCHGDDLRGRYISEFGMSSRNLTRLAKVFSDADFDRVIRHGLTPRSTSVAEDMPSDAFRYMPDADAAAIISYIRSLKPAGADIPEPSYSLKDRWNILQGAKKMARGWFPLQKPALDLGPTHARAREMAMSACGECHGTALEGQGGAPHTPPNLILAASYEWGDFLKFMRTGKAAGNRELHLMSDTARVRFSRLTDGELKALYDYLAARGRRSAGIADRK